MKVIVIDNYDSFTYNIVHYVEQFTDVCEVRLVDKVSLEEIEPFDRIILSPGPGLPSENKMLNKIIKRFYQEKPILGICLGHQALASFFGAELFNLKEVHHGIARNTILQPNDILWNDIASPLPTGRYHSWAVSTNQHFPKELEITGIDEEEQTLMAFKHRKLNIRGIQFHPESVLTQDGLKIIKNWLSIT